MSTLLGRGLLALTTLLVGSLLASSHPAAADTRIELEQYISSWDAGGALIRRASCTDALNGWVADYIDFAGDFIEVELVLDESICFVDSLRSAGTAGSVRTLVTSFRVHPGDVEVSADTVATIPGSGVG
jgi:hypothetical protein